MFAHGSRRMLGVSLTALLLAAPAGVIAATPADPAGATAAEPAATSVQEGPRLSQLFYQLQVLQQEVQELRGLVEEQSYQIQRLARDQQEQYIDLDGRIASLTRGGVSAPRTNPASAPAARTSTLPSGYASVAAGAVAALPSPGGSPGSEREAYTEAFSLMKDRQFDASVAAFNSMIRDYPSGQYTPNAYYWLGELYLAQDATEPARQSFAQVLNLYPDHPKVPDTLYKIGVVYHRLGDNSRAVEYLERVQREHPASTAAELAATYQREL